MSINLTNLKDKSLLIYINLDMVCFCGCELYEKNSDGFKLACIKCGHGPQNHDNEFRNAARKNESQSQKRDADFG